MSGNPARGPIRGLGTAALLLAGCALNTSTLVEPVGGAGDPVALAERARTAWSVERRTREAAEEAFAAMIAAVRATPSGDPDRYARIVDAARYAVWLSRRADEDGASALADSALVLANTAVAQDDGRVEGYYFRAVAAGLIGREGGLRGRAAMGRIREDGNRAVELDPDFDDAGPHRVLGGLYLRAPGPPAGVGSLRRALLHLEEARRRAPEEPLNLLFLAEAYLENDREREARDLLDEAERLLAVRPDDRSAERLGELRERLLARAGQGGSDAPAG